MSTVYLTAVENTNTWPITTVLGIDKAKLNNKPLEVTTNAEGDFELKVVIPHHLFVKDVDDPTDKCIKNILNENGELIGIIPKGTNGVIKDNCVPFTSPFDYKQNVLRHNCNKLNMYQKPKVNRFSNSMIKSYEFTYIFNIDMLKPTGISHNQHKVNLALYLVSGDMKVKLYFPDLWLVVHNVQRQAEVTEESSVNNTADAGELPKWCAFF